MGLEGKDILGSAQTGTGKTGAFCIPMIARLMDNSQETALILTPTRELAVQVHQMVTGLLGRNTPLKTALLIGGEGYFLQLKQLKSVPRIVVGTPGRVNDHIKRGTLSLAHTRFVVLDETDRMLDMGFSIQIDEIMKHMPAQRQTLLFSATLPKNITAMAQRYLKDPVRISVGSTTTPVDRIKQDLMYVSEDEKYPHLSVELEARDGSVVIFGKTKRGVEKLAKRLAQDNHMAVALHGDLNQRKRAMVIRDFRNRKQRILVATDIAARGLDIPHIEHVINYDLPQCPEDYIHRIGRTARAGAEGSALCLISPGDKQKWKLIQRLINPKAAAQEAAAEKAAGHPKKKRYGPSAKSGKARGFGDFGSGFGGGKPGGFKPKGFKSAGAKGAGFKPKGFAKGKPRPAASSY